MKHLIAALLIFAALPSHAQQQCAPVAAVSEGLAQNYGESRQASGVAGNGAGMELYANTDTGTWTLLVVTAGTACLVASGGSYAQRMAGPGVEG